MGKIIAAIVIGIAIIAGIVIFISGVKDEDPQLSNQPQQTSQNAEEEATIDDTTDETTIAEADREYTINMKNYEFSMDEITAAPGETVTINLTSSEGSHNFTIDELNVSSEDISSGEETSVTFTIPEDAVGSYAFYCSMSNHRSLGMEGTLTIVISS